MKTNIFPRQLLQGHKIKNINCSTSLALIRLKAHNILIEISSAVLFLSSWMFCWEKAFSNLASLINQFLVSCWGQKVLIVFLFALLVAKKFLIRAIVRWSEQKFMNVARDDVDENAFSHAHLSNWLNWNFIQPCMGVNYRSGRLGISSGIYLSISGINNENGFRLM